MKRRDEYGLPHDLQTSVCRSGKKGRLRCGGGGRARKKRSSSLLPRDSVCCSAGQSIWSYRQRESPPPAAPHTAEIGAAHRRSLSPPPRRKSGRASSPLRGKKLLFSHCELSRSGRSIWRQWTETGTRLSPFPAPDRTVSPTSADAALPRQQRDLNRGAHSWKSRPQTGIFGSGAYAAASAHNRGNQLPHWMQPPRAPLPSKPRTACVCLQQWWNACRETHTAWTSVTCPRPYNYSLT